MVAVLVVALSTVVAAHANSIATVQNNTSNNLGTVTLYQSNGCPVSVYVPGQGTFNVCATSDIVWAVINGQGVPQGQSGVVTLASGMKVKVTVSGNIVVTDTTIMN